MVKQFAAFYNSEGPLLYSAKYLSLVVKGIFMFKRTHFYIFFSSTAVRAVQYQRVI
jgi:hypothetical protein